ncbi:MAG: cytidine deaminase [Myxococcales bacterium]|nr:cytidine deaminase [Myxococcales bacterium]
MALPAVPDPNAALAGRPDLAELAAAASHARSRAYAPYSGFLVGAALRGKSGRVYTGVNVENASFPVSICAERAALVHAVSEGEQAFDEIAVATDAREPAAPCGLCRQMLAEFGLDLEVTVVGAQGVAWRRPLGELLPHAFTPGSFEPRPARLAGH